MATTITLTPSDWDNPIFDSAYPDGDIPNLAPDISGFSTSIGNDRPAGYTLGTVAADDPEDDNVTATIVSGNSQGYFQMDPYTRVVSIVSNSSSIPAATYALGINVSDSQGNLSSTTVTIIVSASQINNARYGNYNIPSLTEANPTIAARGFEPFEYDPTTIATPVWQAGDYYINPQDVNATDTANDTGSPAIPRLTLPSVVTSNVFVAGSLTASDFASTNSSSAGICRFDGGTSSTPTWLVCLPGSYIDKFTYAGSAYLIIDGLNAVGGTGSAAQAGSENETRRTHHVCLRNFDISDRRWGGGNSTGLGMSTRDIDPGRKIDHIIYFNGTADDCGYRLPNGDLTDWNTGDKDFHAINSSIFGADLSTGQEVGFIWMIDLQLNNNAGNGFQATGQNFTGTYSQAWQYHHDFYAAGCIGQAGREAVLWLKTCGYSVFDANTCFGARNWPFQPGTGIGMQYAAHRMYYINNNLGDNNFGGRQSDQSSTLADQFWFGNYIYNSKDNDDIGSTVPPVEGTGLAAYIVGSIHICWNTFYNNRLGIGCDQRVTGGGSTIYNNIIVRSENVGGTKDGETRAIRTEYLVDVNNNLFYEPGGSYTNNWNLNGTNYSDIASVNAISGNSNNIVADPLFTDTATNDYSVTSTSPARSAARVNSPTLNTNPISEFIADFGFEPLDRNNRSFVDNLTIGASQFDEGV